MIDTATVRTRVYWIASALFLLSGFTGLVYEVIWFKRFTHVWGSSSLAMATVVGAFLCGLGLGAHFLGKLADRARVPLLWYGLCEIAIGGLVVIIPFEIQWLIRGSAPLYLLLEQYTLIHLLVRFGLTVLVIGPPCFLMGGTLPLLIKQFTPPGSALREATGWLYAINTFGAAAGCYVAGFHLLPSIGLYAANLVTAALNLAIGLTALAAARMLTATLAASPEPAPALHENPEPAGVADAGAQPDIEGDPPYQGSTFYAAVGAAGLAALILQMVWARQLALILGGTTYAFSAMLFVILVGIALGSLSFRAWTNRFPNVRVSLTVMIFVLLVGTLAGQQAVEPLSAFAGLVRRFRVSQMFNAFTCVTASMVLEFLPAFAMGFLFPLFVHMTRKGAKDAGKTVGNVYAWNTVGTIIGATVTSSLLLPSWGISMTIAFAVGLYVVALLMIFPTQNNFAILVLFALACPFLLWTAQPNDPQITNAGMYFFGYEPASRLKTKSKLLSLREGPTTSVAVFDSGANVTLKVGGKPDASSAGDMNMQLGLAYFPRFLHPTARNVFVIGYGSGVTVGASLLFPETLVTCCEIEREVYNASKYFAHVNHKPDQSPNYTQVIEDGRSYLQATDEKFDLIISEPSNPWMAGLSNLFTEEFYQAARDHLTPDGILAQWIQLYSYTPVEYAMVVRTVKSVFPHCSLLRISESDTVLLASARSLDVPQKTIQTAQALVNSLPIVQQDLRRYFGITDVAFLLLNHVILGNDALTRLIAKEGSGLINTDLNMRLEYNAPLYLFKPQSRELTRYVLAFTDARWMGDTFQRWGCSKQHLDVFIKLNGAYSAFGLNAVSLQLTNFALQVDPDRPYFLAEKLRLAPPEDPAAFNQAITRLTSIKPTQANRVGVSLFLAKEYDKAARVFEIVASALSQSPSVWHNLAKSYDILEQWDKADQAYLKTLALDPPNDIYIQSYRSFQVRRQAAGVPIAPTVTAPVTTAPAR